MTMDVRLFKSSSDPKSSIIRRISVPVKSSKSLVLDKKTNKINILIWPRERFEEAFYFLQ